MDETAVGWISVMIAIFFYAFAAIPFKIKRVQDTRIEPMVWQLYMCLGIALTSPTILLYLYFTSSDSTSSSTSTSPEEESFSARIWTWYGVAAAFCWVPANSAAFFVIRFIGLGIGLGVWSAFSILTSFLWGVLAFHDPIAEPLLATFGILLLLLGVAGLAFTALPDLSSYRFLAPAYRWLASHYPSSSSAAAASSLEVPMKTFYTPVLTDEQSDHIDHHIDHHIDGEEGEIKQDQDQDHDLITEDHEKGEEHSKHQKQLQQEEEKEEEDEEDEEGKESDKTEGKTSMKNLMIGIGLSLFIAVTNGSMMVPSRLAPCGNQGTYFVFPFGVGVLIASPTLFALYFGLVKRQRPTMFVRQALAPGLAAGLIWYIGNVGSILASRILGLAIGFPLTQCCLVVGGALAIFVFKEISDPVAIALWALSALVVIAGAFLLGFSGGPLPACV